MVFGCLSPRSGCKAMRWETLRCSGRTRTVRRVCGCRGPCRGLSLALVPSKGDLQTLSPTLGLLSWGTQPPWGMGMQSQALGASRPPDLMLEAGAREKS